MLAAPVLCSPPPFPPKPQTLNPKPSKVLRVPLDEFRALMAGGDMLLPSIATGYLAIDKLREEGYL